MKILFAQRLQQLRREHGLKQAQLAEILQTTQRRISYLELEKVEPDLMLLWKLSDYFDVSIDYLVGKEEY